MRPKARSAPGPRLAAASLLRRCPQSPETVRRPLLPARPFPGVHSQPLLKTLDGCFVDRLEILLARRFRFEENQAFPDSRTTRNTSQNVRQNGSARRTEVGDGRALARKRPFQECGSAVAWPGAPNIPRRRAIRLARGGWVESRLSKNRSRSSRAPSRGFTMKR